MDREALRRLSKQWVGNKYRLEVAAALDSWGDEPVSAITLSDHTGIRYPRVQEELKRLAEARLLAPKERQGQVVEYKIVPSVYWSSCADMLRELEASSSSTEE